MTRKLEFIIDKHESTITSTTTTTTTSSSSSTSSTNDLTESTQSTSSIESLNLISNLIQQNKNKNRKIITDFEELRNLEARSRTPIDIQLNENLNNQNLLSNLNLISSSNLNSNLINDSNKKYFSFLTTNKLFSKQNLNQTTNKKEENSFNLSNTSNNESNSSTSISLTNSSIQNSPTVYINKTQTDDLEPVTKVTKDLCEKLILKQNNLRRSIGIDKPCLNSNKTKLSRHSTICFESTNNKQSNSITTSNKIRRTSLETTNYEFKSNKLTKLNKIKNNNNNSTNYSHSRILTVLFDYETYVSHINSANLSSKKIGFSVKKGENVKVLRDYDENFYLVVICSTGKIGFIPKEYTVDLKEVKARFKLQQKYLNQTYDYMILNQTNSNSNYSSSNNISNMSQFKLTKL